MSRYVNPTREQLKGWRKWVSTRPPIVKAMCERLDPWTLYRMGDQRVTLYSFSEDGTVTVIVSPKFNLVLEGLQVFGVDPGRLVECDLPDLDEPVGRIADILEALNEVQGKSLH